MLSGFIFAIIVLIPFYGDVEARLLEHRSVTQNEISDRQTTVRPHSQLYDADVLLNFFTRQNKNQNTDEPVSTESLNNTAVPQTSVQHDIPEDLKDSKSATTVMAESKTTIEPIEIEIEDTPVLTSNIKEEVKATNSHSNSDFEQSFLSLHNEVRADYGVPALVWSDELAEGAANWADTLQDEACALRHSDEPYGENLFHVWSTDQSMNGTPEDAMRWWVDGQEDDYSYETNTCADGEVCGHFTQIIWEDTTEVGCAMTRCTESSKVTDLFVCRYDPAGNIIGERPY